MPKFGRTQKRGFASSAPAAPKGSRTGRGQLGHPPQLRSNIVLAHRYRFTSTSGTATAITVGSLFGAVGNMCTVANTQVQSLFQSLKVRSVSIWTPPAAQGSFATCSVEWLGGANSNTVEVSDTSNSVATPAHIMSAPPRLSLASFWNNSASAANVLMTIAAPSGSIIDVVLDLILSDDESANLVTAVAAGALGVIYYLSLDPNATHRYVPVSLTTTT